MAHATIRTVHGFSWRKLYKIKRRCLKNSMPDLYPNSILFLIGRNIVVFFVVQVPKCVLSISEAEYPHSYHCLDCAHHIVGSQQRIPVVELLKEKINLRWLALYSVKSYLVIVLIPKLNNIYLFQLNYQVEFVEHTAWFSLTWQNGVARSIYSCFDSTDLTTIWWVS